jgi:hypothetical protein
MLPCTVVRFIQFNWGNGGRTDVHGIDFSIVCKLMQLLRGGDGNVSYLQPSQQCRRQLNRTTNRVALRHLLEQIKVHDLKLLRQQNRKGSFSLLSGNPVTSAPDSM